MFSKKFVSILFCVVFVKASIDIYIEDFVMEKINEEYVKDVTAYIDEEGSKENAIVVNFTMIQGFPETSEGHLLLVGASMGEYVLTTPIDFTLPLCDMMTERTLIGPFLEALGFNEDECPPKAGVYGNPGYVIPTEGLTEDFDPNKYKASFEIIDNEVAIMKVVFYLTVQ